MTSASSKPPPLEEPPAARRARAVVALLSTGKFADVTNDFDATMKAALPEEKLAATWRGIEQSAGAFDRVVEIKSERAGAYESATVTSKFGSTTLDVRIAFDASWKIAGLFVTKTPALWSPPPYGDPKASVEREVTVSPGPWALPGTLTLPQGKGPFPAVVLVHGSGPSDRDETVGGSKPFKDLALGLAARGVAVLRFEKRTKQHGPKIEVASFKLDEESVDDAVAAVDLLATEPAVDPARIFVLGHSLGATFAPRIGARSKRVAGIAMLAGTTRSLPDVMLEQMRYIDGLDGKTSPEEKAAEEEVVRAQKRIRELQKGADPKPGEIILGAGAEYWIEMGKYDPIETLKTFEGRVFLAQGQRDYQVSEADFQTLSRAVAGRPRVVAKLYPDLNHLFVKGSGKSTPDEYREPGHVEAQVVEDLAKFFTDKS